MQQGGSTSTVAPSLLLASKVGVSDYKTSPGNLLRFFVPKIQNETQSQIQVHR